MMQSIFQWVFYLPSCVVATRNFLKLVVMGRLELPTCGL